MARIEVLRIPFDALTLEESVEQCVRWARERRGPHVVTTVNAAHLSAMRRDAALREATLASDLIVADGVPLLWVAWLAGRALPGRVAGIDLMQQLLERGSREGLRAFFLGATADVLAGLRARCAAQYPGLAIAGAHHGYFDARQLPVLVRQIRESRADFLFVGMPTPAKELFAHRHGRALGTPVILGVGGSFDVLAGKVRRAPRVMQRAGLEWLFRLAQEPRRLWKRYLVGNTELIALAAREALFPPRTARSARDRQSA